MTEQQALTGKMLANIVLGVFDQKENSSVESPTASSTSVGTESPQEGNSSPIRVEEAVNKLRFTMRAVEELKAIGSVLTLVNRDRNRDNTDDREINPQVQKAIDLASIKLRREWTEKLRVLRREMEKGWERKIMENNTELRRRIGEEIRAKMRRNIGDHNRPSKSRRSEL